jgi:hypothetical protein
MDVDGPATNGNTKRKSRASISKPVYKDGTEDDSDEDAVPLVRQIRSPLPSSNIIASFLACHANKIIRPSVKRSKRLSSPILMMILHSQR